MLLLLYLLSDFFQKNSSSLGPHATYDCVKFRKENFKWPRNFAFVPSLLYFQINCVLKKSSIDMFFSFFFAKKKKSFEPMYFLYVFILKTNAKRMNQNEELRWRLEFMRVAFSKVCLQLFGCSEMLVSQQTILGSWNYLLFSPSHETRKRISYQWSFRSSNSPTQGKYIFFPFLAWNWSFPPLKSYAKHFKIRKMMRIIRSLRRNGNCHGWIMARQETIQIIICFFPCFTFPFFRSHSILGHQNQERKNNRFILRIKSCGQISRPLIDGELPLRVLIYFSFSLFFFFCINCMHIIHRSQFVK